MPDPKRLLVYERLGVLLAGALIVLALLYLVLTGKPVSPALADPLRLLLALAASAFGLVLPGAALQVGYRGSGLALRAVGSAGFFTLVWLGGPKLLPALAASVRAAGSG